MSLYNNTNIYKKISTEQALELDDIEEQNYNDFIELNNDDIDEISDLCKEDKEMFKLWNSYYRKKQFELKSKHLFNGLREQIRGQLSEFVDLHFEVLKTRLYVNFVLHLVTFCNYGFIDQHDITRILRKLNGLPEELVG